MEEHAASVPKLEVPAIALATSVLRGLRRTLEEITGVVDAVEAGPTVEEECPVCTSLLRHKSTGFPLDPKMVADAVNEELTFMRRLQVYHEIPGSYYDESGLTSIGTRWIHMNKSDAANPLVRARLVAQETKRVSELTPEDASSTFCGNADTGKGVCSIWTCTERSTQRRALMLHVKTP